MKKLLLLVFLICLAPLVPAQEITGYGLVLGVGWSGFHGGDADDMAAFFPSDSSWPDGINGFSHAGENTKGDLSGSLGWMAGLYMKLDWNDWLFNRAELYYTWRGASYEKNLTLEETYGPQDSIDKYTLLLDGDDLLPGTRRYDLLLAYLDLPLMVGVNLGKDFTVFAGPSIRYALHNTFTVYFQESEINDDEFLGNRNRDVELDMVPITWGVVGGFTWNINDQFALGLRYQHGLTDIIDNDNKPKIQDYAASLSFDFNFNEW